MQITITLDEQSGQLTVETDDGRPPYQCSSAEECMDYLEGLLGGEPAEEAGEGEPVPSGDMAAMWQEEAAKRPPNPSLMA